MLSVWPLMIKKVTKHLSYLRRRLHAKGLLNAQRDNGSGN